MRNKLFFSFLFFLFTASGFSQTETKNIRIVDSLTPQEKKARNPLILKSELDSLIKMYDTSIVKAQIQIPVKEETNNNPLWLIVALSLSILLAGLLGWLFYQHKRRLEKITREFKKQLLYPGQYAGSPGNGLPNEKEKKIISDMQIKTRGLNARLEKMKTDNESLNAVLKEYSRTQNEYESLLKSISKTFKVKKYPGSSEGKTDIETLLGLFETERCFTMNVYENYLKPIVTIADTNKNNPANISKEQREKLLELLISLSLLYIEYLYLRVNELSVGGNMVQRINDIKNGLGLNPSLLKKLNTQNGSRALVLHLALEKINLNNLSYPVFEETDLNHH